MKRLALLCVLAACFTGVASAQDMSKIDVFGGYSFAHLSADGFGINFNGGSGSIAYNANSWLGIVADFGGYHTNSEGESGNLFTYMFGPRVSMRHGKLKPFVQALFGGGHLSASGDCGDSEECSASENGFAMTLGGGVDWAATEHIGIRLAQIEYFHTHFENTGENGIRFSTGVVFSF
jgi:opacity protein-like surface antigen